MKPEIIFLLKTAAKMHAVMRDDEAPLEHYCAAVVHYVEFSVLADELAAVDRPKPEIVGIPVTPKPTEAPEPRERHCFCGARIPLAHRSIYCSSVCAQVAKARRMKERSAAKRAETDSKGLISETFIDSKELIFEEPKERPTPRIQPTFQAVIDEEEIPDIPKPKETQEIDVELPERAPKVRKDPEIGLKRLVKAQHGRCAYCFRFFGERVFKAQSIVKLHAVREHFMPKSVGGSVLFASCQLCNIFKRDYMFDSLAACREWLAGAWIRAGYSDAKGHFIADGWQFSRN